MLTEKFLVFLICNFCSYHYISSDELIVKLYNIGYEQVNPEFVAGNLTCHLKAINRHKTIINVDAWLLKPIKTLTFQATFYRFYSQFRPYLINITFNFCDVMSKKAVTTFYIRVFLRMMRNTTNMIHECPWNGHVFVRDAYYDASLVKLPIPVGRYKLYLALYEKYPENLFIVINAFTEVYYTKK